MDDMLPGMPTRLFVATPTKLLTFADCKRKYRYTYLETPRPPKGPPWAHNTVGAIVHEVLADFFGRWPAARRTPDEVVAKMRSSWRSEGFRDEQQSLDWRDRSTDMVLGYLRDSDPYYEPRGVERTVAFTTERASLRGRVDRIDERAGPRRERRHRAGDRRLQDRSPPADLDGCAVVARDGAVRPGRSPSPAQAVHPRRAAPPPDQHRRRGRPRRRVPRPPPAPGRVDGRRRRRGRGPLARGPDPGRGRRSLPTRAVRAVRLVRLRPHLPPRPPRIPTPRPLGRPRRHRPRSRSKTPAESLVPAPCAWGASGGPESGGDREGLPDGREDCEQAGGAGGDAALRGDRIRVRCCC